MFGDEFTNSLPLNWKMSLWLLKTLSH